MAPTLGVVSTVNPSETALEAQSLAFPQLFPAQGANSFTPQVH